MTYSIPPIKSMKLPPLQKFKAIAVTDSARKQANDVIRELQDWQVGLNFTRGKLISLAEFMTKLEYAQLMDSIGAYE
jgi:hypothetical protein